MFLDKEKSGERKKARHRIKNPHNEPKCSPALKADILWLLKNGCTLTEISSRDEMPSFPVLFDWRKADPDFDAAIQEAMQVNAEYIVKEGLDLVRVETDRKNVDTDRQKVMAAYSDAALKYAAAIAPRKFGALAKLGAEGSDTPHIHIVAFGSAPMDSAAGPNIVSARPPIDAIQPQIQAADHGTPQSAGKIGNGSDGPQKRRPSAASQVQANPSSARKAKRHKRRA